MQDNKQAARDLLGFIDASPSPFHACGEVARRLEGAGFRQLEELESWSLEAGGFFVVRGGSLVAWLLPDVGEPWTGFRIAGAHTDSPNLRIKPRPDTGRAGYAQVGVEVYGGVLLNSWLDRDLGLSGRLHLRDAEEPHLFRIDRPILRVPQLAIHLDREVNDKGLKLNPQKHLVPVLGLESVDYGGFLTWLGDELDVDPARILSWDAMLHDTLPASLSGAREEFVVAPRLDNLCSTFEAIEALIALAGSSEAPKSIPVVSLFDHEEVGSTSARGAGSSLLGTLLERVVHVRGGGREDYHRALAGSFCASIDMAHATHPNYTEKHDPSHRLSMNAGPVIKVNSNLRYASEGETEALFQSACEAAGVPYQKWVNRTDLACGSTIGPITAARLGIGTVDVGGAQLAMHSIREMCGSVDPGLMIAALIRFLG